MSIKFQQALRATLIAAAAVLIIFPASFAAAQTKAELDPAQFKWKTSPSALQAQLEERLNSRQGRAYSKLSRSVNLHGTTWQQFFIFHHDELIAQGYERQESLHKPRVGSISDVVSYNNVHQAATRLSRKYGEPAFKDVRTREQYSQEMGDDALRARRSLEWDLYGERYRWELKNGTIRYTVQYSMDGRAEHRIVNVNPGKWAHYFDFMTVQAFRHAGKQRVQRFRQKANTWITAQFGARGQLKTTERRPRSAGKPQPARRTQQTSNRCTVAGKACVMTYHYYGRHLYQVDVDFSQQGSYPRRGHHSDLGKAFYTRFHDVNTGLQRQFGNPQDEQIIKDMDNGREALKAANLVNGQQGFWSIWYEAPSDTLVRHVITGKDVGGTGYQIDHTISYRFHHVARALAERDAWEAETRQISSK